MPWIPLPFALALALALSATAGLSADAPLRPEKLREAMGLKLGGWQTTFRLMDVKANFPKGVNPEQGQRLVSGFRAKMEKDRIRKECLSDLPDRLKLPGLNAPKACDYSRLEARDGKFRIKSLCKGADAVLETFVTGEYDPEHLTARSEVTSSVGGVRLHVKMDSESRFTGECAPTPTVEDLPENGG